MKLLSLFILFGFLNPAHSKANDLPTLASLEALDTAATVLRVIIDGKKLPNCKFSPSDISKLPNVINADLDTNKKSYLAAATKTEFPNVKAIDTCEADCHCGLYSDLYEASTLETKLEMKHALKAAKLKASKLTNNQAHACASTATWFCSSSLLKQLRAEAKNF